MKELFMRTNIAERVLCRLKEQNRELSMLVAPTKFGLGLMLATLFVGVSTFAAERTDLVGPVVGRGADGSGGGNAKVCFDSREIVSNMRFDHLHGGGYIKNSDISHIVSVELLDLHKAKLPTLSPDGDVMNPTIVEALPGETQKQYEGRILKRLSLVPSVRLLLDQSKALVKEVKGVPNGLAPIDDVNSGEMINADNCVRSTIIAQYDELGKTHVLFDSRIFALPLEVFPASSRAMAFWHEYFYALKRIEAKEMSSDSTQTFVGTLVKEGVTVQAIVSATEDFIRNTSFNGKAAETFVDALDKDLRESLVKDKVVTFPKRQESVSGIFAVNRVENRAKEIQREMRAQQDAELPAVQAKVREYYELTWKNKIFSTPYVSRETAEYLDREFQRALSTTFSSWANVFFSETGNWTERINCTAGYSFANPKKMNGASEIFYKTKLPDGKDI
jgi:hypothetical protein